MIRRVVVAGLIVTGLVWAAWRWRRPETPSPIVGTAVDSSRAGVRSVTLYFAAPSGDGLVAEPREVVEVTELHDHAAVLVAELDHGPRQGGVATLPAGTSVLHVFMDEHGLLTLDLSRAFQEGFHGGAGGEYLAIASLVRTLAANLPGVRRIQITCGGEAIATLAGHLPLDRPLEVADWP